MTSNRFAFFLLIICSNFILLILSGCAEQENYSAEITGNVPGLHQRQRKLPHPQADRGTSAKKPVIRNRGNFPRGWVPSRFIEKKWTAIVIHHSATNAGSMASFDNYHKNGNGWDGVGYDFVIGNGNGSGNGQVQVTFRWTQQKIGAHCRTDSTNWANKEAVGICLVGNFDKTLPTYSQMSSLVKLVRFLSKRYNIPKSRIYGHNTTPRRSTKTDCPGKRFSMSKFKSML